MSSDMNEKQYTIYGLLFGRSVDFQEQALLEDGDLLSFYLQLVETGGRPPFPFPEPIDETDARDILRHVAGLIGRIAPQADEAAVTSLLGLLSHPTAKVKTAAATALGKLKAPKAAQPLVAMLDEMESQNDPGGVICLTEALGDLGDPACLPRLEALAATHGSQKTKTAKTVVATATKAIDKLV